MSKFESCRPFIALFLDNSAIRQVRPGRAVVDEAGFFAADG